MTNNKQPDVREFEEWYADNCFPHPTQNEYDIARSAYCAALQSPSVANDGWKPITAAGQVKVGDPLRFSIGEECHSETALLILHGGTDKEEVVYNRKRNFYFITSMILDGTSSHKNLRFLAKDASPQPLQQQEQSGEVEIDCTNMDAAHWAKAFCAKFPGHDEGLMIAWFASAIMCGWDNAHWKMEEETPPSPESQAAPQPLQERELLGYLTDHIRWENFQAGRLTCIPRITISANPYGEYQVPVYLAPQPVAQDELVEPTEEMLLAAEMSQVRDYQDLYGAMLVASPQPPQQEQRGVGFRFLAVSKDKPSNTRLEYYVDDSPGWEWFHLPRTVYVPPQLDAAVEAFRQAVEGILQARANELTPEDMREAMELVRILDAILTLPSSTKALEDVCMKVAEEVSLLCAKLNSNREIFHPDMPQLVAIVQSVIRRG